MKKANVYIVGAGPGDPELITVKGMRAIQQADVILYDRLINDELLQYAKQEAEIIYCGKLPNFHAMKQETINHFLVKHAKLGKIVTRLKGGDPFVFGRGGEEAEVLAKQGISFEIVPGVTAGIAAAAYAGIPLTHRNWSRSFTCITGHIKTGEPDDINWKVLAQGIDTIAVYMGIGNLPYVCEQLLRYGKSSQTPVAIIERGTTSQQRTITSTLEYIVKKAREKEIENPSMIIIGEVVRFHDSLQWFESSPLDQVISHAF